jgi:hypothetical protein
MDFKRFLSFAAKVTVAHVASYFVVGAAAYQLLTKPFYEGSNPVFSIFMRTPAEPELWKHVMIWFIPGQVLRGVLIAAVLYPLFDTLNAWSWGKRLLSISGLYLVLGYWASAVAAPGTIDGLIYLRPEITPGPRFVQKLFRSRLLFHVFLGRLDRVQFLPPLRPLVFLVGRLVELN